MKRAGSLALMAVGTILVIAALGWTSLEKRYEQPAPLALPARLASLPLSSQMNGPEAVKNFMQMHRERFPLITYSVGI